jgi:hypothetical protein
MRTIYEISAKSVELVSTRHIRAQIGLLDKPEWLVCMKGSPGFRDI